MTKPLVRHLNAGNLWSLPEGSSVPRLETCDINYAAIKAEGVIAIQHHFPDEAVFNAGLLMTGMGRVLAPDQARAIAETQKGWSFLSSTWHVGTGLETDAEMDALAGAVLDAQAATGLPITIETHRATMTQDIRRTLSLIERFPELRFTADLSHWYTGHEMTYGDIAAKFDAMEPVFERVRYIHGRIGTPCCVQVAIDANDDRAFVGNFREMWQRCIAGFKRTAAAGEMLPFAPELLPYSISIGGQEHLLYYAQQVGNIDTETEQSDRWEQAQILWEIAKDCEAL
ncbi:MAG: hypothetical protein AAFY34_13380 [Pseudomonadota bacterium]